jgi:hypothetical protein
MENTWTCPSNVCISRVSMIALDSTWRIGWMCGVNPPRRARHMRNALCAEEASRRHRRSSSWGQGFTSREAVMMARMGESNEARIASQPLTWRIKTGSPWIDARAFGSGAA